MKIFSAAQIKACDAYTIQASGIHSADLMERAANRCVDWLRAKFLRDTLFVVLCGTGNNGGDGLAITRLLHQRNFGVKAFLLKLTDEMSPDCAANYQRLKMVDDDLVTSIEQDTFLTDLPQHIVVIDALLGTGISRPPEGWLAQFIDRINLMPNIKVSIDLPSGLSPDNAPDPETSIIKATHSLTFQFYKRCFLHPESAPYTGLIHLLDIELDRHFILQTHTQYRIAEKADIIAIYRPRNMFGHKGTYGKALLVGGSYGKTGAITLASKATLRAGAGLVTALLPVCGLQNLQTAVPEVMCLTHGEQHLDDFPMGDYDAVGLGPGMGTHAETVKALSAFIDACRHPLIVDADALNIISQHPDLLNRLPKGSVLTPHPKEFSRLFGENTNSMIQLDNARIQAMRYNLNIVLKGRYTAVINTEGECWYNITGNPGMATAGSGDVLTGIITGLHAQGYSPFEAALMGVYLHGVAGDFAAEALSQEAMIASDIIDHLGKAFLELRK